MRSTFEKTLASALAIATVIGATSVANAATARSISSAANERYQAHYNYMPATQPQVVRPQAAQAQATGSPVTSSGDRDIYFYHSMGTMSHP